jgi:hypothetical protein
MDGPAPDRDIELVLITGAGASRAFGVNRPMPLMGDWVEDLVKRLGELGVGYVQASGLSRDMDGQQFEEQLGAFLRSVQAFNEIKPLLEPMTQFAGSPSMFMPADAWEQWHNAASHQLAQIVGAIHKSLYALFADAPINERAAERAYGALFSELGLSPTAGVVYATTNYDTSRPRCSATTSSSSARSRQRRCVRLDRLAARAVESPVERRRKELGSSPRSGHAEAGTGPPGGSGPAPRDLPVVGRTDVT